MRVQNFISKRDWADPSPVIVLADSVAKDAFPDETKSPDEIITREIFNCGANNVYYRYGETCDNVNNFNAYIVPGQMLEVSVLQRVSCFAVGGSKVSITRVVRNDMVAHGSAFPQ